MNIKAAAFVVVLALLAAPAAARAEALAGTVSSAEEGATEGVLVSAKRAGSNMTVTVVTDAQGFVQNQARAAGLIPALKS